MKELHRKGCLKNPEINKRPPPHLFGYPTTSARETPTGARSYIHKIDLKKNTKFQSLPHKIKYYNLSTINSIITQWPNFQNRNFEAKFA